MVGIIYHRLTLGPKLLVSPFLPHFVVVYAVACLHVLRQKFEMTRILRFLSMADAIANLHVLEQELMIACSVHLLGVICSSFSSRSWAAHHSFTSLSFHRAWPWLGGGGPGFPRDLQMKQAWISFFIRPYLQAKELQNRELLLRWEQWRHAAKWMKGSRRPHARLDCSWRATLAFIQRSDGDNAYLLKAKYSASDGEQCFSLGMIRQRWQHFPSSHEPFDSLFSSQQNPPPWPFISQISKSERISIP